MDNDLIQAARIIANQCTQRNTPSTWTYEYAISRIESLMRIVADREREQCAKVCEAVDLKNAAEIKGLQGFLAQLLAALAETIRARTK